MFRNHGLRMFCALLGVLGACAPDGENTGTPTDESWPTDEKTFNVQWSPSVTRIDAGQLDMVREADTANEQYTLDAAAVRAAGLDVSPGRILVIHGLALRRIAAVEEQQDALIIDTEPARLTEAITEGTIAWDYGVSFTPDRVKSVSAAGKTVAIKPNPRIESPGDPIVLDIEIDPFTYHIEVTLEDTRATFRFTITRDLGGAAQAKFTAEGHLERFRSRDLIEIRGGAVQTFRHNLEKLRGEATLELIATASGRDVVNLELPATILSVPFLIGPIPVELNIKAQFVINASVPIDGSSWVRARFRYDSDLGLAYDGTQVGAEARMGNPETDAEKTQTGASFAVAANFGVGFPRVELSMARESVVPWAQTAFLIGGSFAPAHSTVPLCQTADAEFLGAAGYDLSFLGVVNIASGSIRFFDYKKELLRAGECPE